MAEQDTPPPTITAMKIPIIKKGEYDIWSMRMRQYICHTDHNLWDVIVNGDLEEEAAPSGEFKPAYFTCFKNFFIMENANPPPTNNPPALPTTLYAKVFQELNELQAISAYIDSRLENINQFLNGFTQPRNEIDMDDIGPDDESVDTPLVSPFLHSDNDSDDGEVLNELEEYGNAGQLCRQRV
ncbi:hypothetical protein Tco_0531728 [Tanacetum coccineum]